MRQWHQQLLFPLNTVLSYVPTAVSFLWTQLSERAAAEVLECPSSYATELLPALKSGIRRGADGDSVADSGTAGIVETDSASVQAEKAASAWAAEIQKPETWTCPVFFKVSTSDWAYPEASLPQLASPVSCVSGRSG